MGFSKTIYSLIGVFVAVIMIATVAMPAITSASTTTTTTTTTEVQDVEVSNPIYYSDVVSTQYVMYYDATSFEINFQHGGTWKSVYINDQSGRSIPVWISDTLVIEVYYSIADGYYKVCTCGVDLNNNVIKKEYSLAQKGNKINTQVSTTQVDLDIGGSSRAMKLPSWCWRIYSEGSYVSSITQESVVLGSLTDAIVGFVDYTGGTSNTDWATYYDGVSTGANEFIFNSTQTDQGLVLSLDATYNGMETLIIVPTQTEIEVVTVVTVQSEYGPILNVVLLMLLIVPVTAVAAMLYARRD